MIVILLPGFLCCCVLLNAVYNVYFHPLRKIPGPKSWIAFPILRHLSALRGRLDRDILHYHERYGEVLRYSDVEVSFITAQAWNEIYGHGRSLEKFNNREAGAKPDIIMSSAPDHSRFRRVLAHAFSEKGMRTQEPIIRRYIDQLMQSLREEATAEKRVDMTMWYNLTTFDIVSELSFGKTFGCLQSRSYNEYIEAIFGFVQLGPYIRIQKVYTALWDFTAGLLVNGGVKAGRKRLRNLSKNAAMDRIYSDEENHGVDFMDAMLKHRGTKNGLTDDEIASNANILFIAGSETTATLLAGVTYWLTQTPYALKRATSEVRSAFERENDITFTAASHKLPYLLACLDEAFRLYPPVPLSLQRIADKTITISGYNIPAKSLVGVHQMSAYQTQLNWHRAKEFIPERFLSESKDDPQSPFYNDNRGVLQPFSVGPRNCIGRNLAYNEMRVIMARMLWNFDLAPAEDNPNWVEDQKTMTLWVKAPLWCKITAKKDPEAEKEKISIEP